MRSPCRRVTPRSCLGPAAPGCQRNSAADLASSHGDRQPVWGCLWKISTGHPARRTSERNRRRRPPMRSPPDLNTDEQPPQTSRPAPPDGRAIPLDRTTLEVSIDQKADRDICKWLNKILYKHGKIKPAWVGISCRHFQVVDQRSNATIGGRRLHTETGRGAMFTKPS